MATKTYWCEGCGGFITVQESDPIPECCGKEMGTEPCIKAQSAESSRLEDSDEACDDGVH